MTTHHALPTSDEFAGLRQEAGDAVSIYLPTAPLATRLAAATALKSALDQVAVDHPRVGAATEHGRALLGDEALWSSLSRSLAVFLSANGAEVFVLPNRLEHQVSVGRGFELGQLWRSLTTTQEALALTVSADRWALWHATPDNRIIEVEVPGDHPADAGTATRRAAAGREDDRLSGDPYALYAKRVVDAVAAPLSSIDPRQELVLVVVGDERLMHLVAERVSGRRVVGLPGNPDRIDVAELDSGVRELLDELNVADTRAEVAGLLDGDQANVERDLAAIARMAVKSGIDTFWFDMTTSVPGELDPITGELTYDDTGSDLLAPVAGLVHDNGGRVVAVRGKDLHDQWTGPALARLRFSLADGQ